MRKGLAYSHLDFKPVLKLSFIHPLQINFVFLQLS